MRFGCVNTVTDENGVEWLDMLSGILNVSLGHGSHVVANALTEVAACGLVNTYDRYSQNSRLLIELLGEYEPRYSWKLLNTGAEAVERAVQVCAALYGRSPVVAVIDHSFHGKSISMSGIRYDVPWGNPLNVIKINPYGNDVPDFDMLLFEPIRGWDGFKVEEATLRKLCDDRGALLVADEMITGFLRCHRRFLSTSADMVISGKGLAQGVPLAVLGINHEMPQTHFSIGWNTTCGGNNLSATVGLHVLRHLIHNERKLQDKVLALETQLAVMGFKAFGALAFKEMRRPQSEMRPVFEQNRVIASWHDTFLRVGPSFLSPVGDMEKLSTVLKLAEMD